MSLMNMMHLKSLSETSITAFSESFEHNNGQVERVISQGPVPLSRTALLLPNGNTLGGGIHRLQDTFYQNWLRQNVRPRAKSAGKRFTVVDLFAGCGGMSLGISEAILAFGRDARHVLAAEQDQRIADVYQANIRPENLHVGDISAAIDGTFGQPPTANERDLIAKVSDLDLLCGGPPCQGHSDLNNYTRRDDPRNSLYFLMARAAELFRPKAVLIENVPGVKRDRTGNFGSTVLSLEELGYSVSIMTLNAKEYGVPQSRKRTFVFAIAGEVRARRWEAAIEALMDPDTRTPLWAFEDLLDIEPARTFDEASELSEESRARVEWLFENNRYELDNSMRPDCHRLKSHSYNSVYGRMRPDAPAPTMTTGFLVMGQGRFIHPTKRRTLTPHEGARIQTFPDFFDFGDQRRGVYARMIGNAVPPLLAYYVGLASMGAIFD